MYPGVTFCNTRVTFCLHPRVLFYPGVTFYLYPRVLFYPGVTFCNPSVTFYLYPRVSFYPGVTFVTLVLHSASAGHAAYFVASCCFTDASRVTAVFFRPFSRVIAVSLHASKLLKFVNIFLKPFIFIQHFKLVSTPNGRTVHSYSPLPPILAVIFHVLPLAVKLIRLHPLHPLVVFQGERGSGGGRRETGDGRRE